MRIYVTLCKSLTWVEKSSGFKLEPFGLPTFIQPLDDNEPKNGLHVKIMIYEIYAH